jgi:hypothetical protein
MLSIALPRVNKPNHLTGLGTMIFIEYDLRTLVVTSLHLMKNLVSPRRARSSRRKHKVMYSIFVFVFFVVFVV